MFSYKPQWDSFYIQDQNYYHRDAAHPPSLFPPLGQTHRADTCIIGGGLSGLSCAHFLRQAGKSVALLERHTIGYGASGRNGGQILSGFAADIRDIHKEVGTEKTRTIWNMSLEGVATVEQLIAHYNIDCAHKQGSLIATTERKSCDDLIELQRFMQDTLGYESDMLDPDQTNTAIGSSGYRGALRMKHGGHFHPLQYAQALARGIKESGVDIFCQSPAEAIIHKDNKFYISTPSGMVIADKIALCGDSYQGNLVPKLRTKYVLLRSAQIATEPLPADLNVLPTDECVFEESRFYHFFRKSADNRLLFGGGDVVRPLNTSLNTQEKIISTLKKQLPSVFPQLRDVRIDYGWGGYIAMTSSKMPNIGEVAKNAFFVNGYSGHGINASHLCGKLLAEAMTEGSGRYKIMQGFSNKSFPGHGRYDHWLARVGLLLHKAGLY